MAHYHQTTTKIRYLSLAKQRTNAFKVVSVNRGASYLMCNKKHCFALEKGQQPR